MGRVLSDDNRDPHRYDPSPRRRCPSNDRGWRIRSDLYPGYELDKAGVRIEELEAKVAELEDGRTLRPIEKAPRDGTRVVFLYGQRREVYWSKKRGCWQDICGSTSPRHKRLDHYIVMSDQSGEVGS